jgi:esterase/lipase
MYQEIKVPVFIVSPGVDDVVSKSEMRSLFQNVSGAKDWLELEAEDHTSTPKREDDIVVGVQNYNKSFLPMLRKLEQFMNINFR